MAKEVVNVDIDIDKFMDKTGHFGRFEILTYALISFSIMYCSFSTFSYSWTAALIRHRCRVPECEKATTIDFEPDWLQNAMDFTGSSCRRYGNTSLAKESTDFKHCPNSWFNKSQHIKCDEEDLIYEFNDHTIMHDFDLQCEKSKYLALVGTLNNVGQALGYPTTGFLSDKFGRMPLLTISVIGTVLFGFLHMFSISLYDFLIYEILMGVFLTGIFNSGYVLAVELVGSKARVVGGVLISTFYTFGVAFLGVVAIFVRDWRHYSYVHLPFILCASYFFILPESTRWLKMKGKEEELKSKLIYIAKLKGFKYTEQDLEQFKVTKEEGAEPQVDAETNPKVESKKGSKFMRLLHSRVLFLRLINCYYCWITNALIYVGLQLATSAAFGNRHLNFIVTGLVEIPAYIITPFLADHLGRRNTLCASLLVSGICSLAVAFLAGNIAGTVVYYIAKLAITISYAVIYVFTAELFPTEIRHSLIGTCSMIARLGAITAPQWSVLNSLVKGLPFYIFAFAAITSGFLIFLLPETLHKKLPDTIEEAEQITKTEK